MNGVREISSQAVKKQNQYQKVKLLQTRDWSKIEDYAEKHMGKWERNCWTKTNVNKWNPDIEFHNWTCIWWVTWIQLWWGKQLPHPLMQRSCEMMQNENPFYRLIRRFYVDSLMHLNRSTRAYEPQPRELHLFIELRECSPDQERKGHSEAYASAHAGDSEQYLVRGSPDQVHRCLQIFLFEKTFFIVIIR